MTSSEKLLVFTAVFVVLVTIVFGCDPSKIRFGCRLHERECYCGVGCDLQYRYTSRKECMAALRGRAKDPCHKKPCKNLGICTQKSEHPGYNCLCVSTGFYGPRCEHKCPSPMQVSKDFPVDCIVI